MNKETIQKLVEEFYELDITRNTRKRNYVKARAMYYKIVRDNTRLRELMRTEYYQTKGKSPRVIFNLSEFKKSNIE